jgi:hypothetical protein
LPERCKYFSDRNMRGKSGRMQTISDTYFIRYSLHPSDFETERSDMLG